jgi:hypothetical protein
MGVKLQWGTANLFQPALHVRRRDESRRVRLQERHGAGEERKGLISPCRLRFASNRAQYGIIFNNPSFRLMAINDYNSF